MGVELIVIDAVLEDEEVIVEVLEGVEEGVGAEVGDSDDV